MIKKWDSKPQGYETTFSNVSRSKVALFRFPDLARQGKWTQDPEALFSAPVIKGLDNYAELIGPPVIVNLSTLMSGGIHFLFSQANELKDLLKPDGLRFVRGGRNSEIKS